MACIVFPRCTFGKRQYSVNWQALLVISLGGTERDDRSPTLICLIHNWTKPVWYWICRTLSLKLNEACGYNTPAGYSCILGCITCEPDWPVQWVQKLLTFSVTQPAKIDVLAPFFVAGMHVLTWQVFGIQGVQWKPGLPHQDNIPCGPPWTTTDARLQKLP